MHVKYNRRNTKLRVLIKGKNIYLPSYQSVLELVNSFAIFRVSFDDLPRYKYRQRANNLKLVQVIKKKELPIKRLQTAAILKCYYC